MKQKNLLKKKKKNIHAQKNSILISKIIKKRKLFITKTTIEMSIAGYDYPFSYDEENEKEEYNPDYNIFSDK